MAFAERLGLDYPLLSDFNREVVKSYAIQYEQPYNDMTGMAKRSVFVIAPDGTVRYKWVTEDAGVPPNVQQVIECLEELRQPSS